MLKRLAFCLMVCSLCVACRDKKNVAKTDQLGNALKGLIPTKGAAVTPENALIASYAEQATAAIKNSNFFDAIVIMQGLGSQTNLTFEQSMAVQETMASVQSDLARRAEAGDASAQQSIQALKMRGHGR